GMFDQLDVEVAERTHKERLLRIRLSEQVMREMGLSTKASPRMDVTLDRMLAANRPDTHMLDLNSKLMQYLLNKACEYDFGALTAMLKAPQLGEGDRKSTRLNSSHVKISYAVFCLKKKNEYHHKRREEVLPFSNEELPVYPD